MLELDILWSLGVQLFKVVKWGNSLAVILLSKWVKEMGIKEGDYLNCDFLKVRQLSHDEALELKNA